MKYFEVGQTVYYLADGVVHDGVVTSICDDEKYPILVDVANGKRASFTHEGCLLEGYGTRLFQTKPIITPNVPIFEERPAYFYRTASETWTYDILCEIDKFGNGLAKNANTLFSLWQYEAPTL